MSILESTKTVGMVVAGAGGQGILPDGEIIA